MSCNNPIKAFRTPDGVVFKEAGNANIIGDIEIPCGMCVGCRIRRAEDWAIRCVHEASLWDKNCFVTLTYGRDKLPAYGNLEHRDFQLFLKRVRKNVGEVRYYMCGEYGPETKRPHYHACLFGQDFREGRVPAGKSKSGNYFYTTPVLDELWGHGFATVQDFTKETASYCAQYIMTKKLGKVAGTDFEYVDSDGVLCYREPEYNRMSLKPGIGAAWLEKYVEDIYRHDVAVVDGMERRPPRYYDKLMKRKDDEALRMEQISWKREQKARKIDPHEKSDERRAVKELVAKARVRDGMKRMDI